MKTLPAQGNIPFRRGPEYRTLFLIGTPEEFSRGPIFHSRNLRGLPEDRGWRPGAISDPLTQALHAAGVTPAEQYTFRMLGEDFRMECPLIGHAF